jgi:hypothetical protein
MEIVAQYLKDELKVVLRGESISMQDAMDFKKLVSTSIAKNMPTKLQIIVEEAYALPSSIVGALLKYKEIEKISVELIVKRAELMDSLERLALVELLNARIN